MTKGMALDTIYNRDCVPGMAELVPDESVDLIIADPPYFKVVGEKWDYSWKTEDDYIAWSERWISEAVRALRKGGTFYLFGYFRMLSRLLPTLESCGLELRQQIIVNKGMKAVSGRATKGYKLFPNVTESILFLYKDSRPYVRELLKSRQKELGISAKEINEALGVKSNGGGMWSIYTGHNICKQLPTKQVWSKLEQILGFSVPYESISQTFNTHMGITDVWDDVDFYRESGRFHPTQKPRKLIERLVLASSNEGDLVLDPFIGSGTTGEVCLKNNRRFLGFEKEGKYYTGALERVRAVENEKSSVEVKRCGTCKWHDDFSWACFNGDADDCADYTNPEHSCPEWESMDSKLT